jgi:ActR/RegA family two-component response regulator
MDQLETLLVDTDGSLDRARRIHDRMTGLVREDEAAAVSLAEIAREAASLVGPTFAARGVALDVRVKAEAWVNGRRSQLTQLVVQLLANALDSAPPGFSMTGAVVVTVAQQGGRASLAVEEPRLTSNPRGRAGESKAVKPTLGIGLTLARQLAALHQGALDLAVLPSGGSEVKLSLPSRAGAKPSGLAPPSSNQPETTPRVGGSLVWVDDDPLFLRSIKRLLKGWRVDTARSAAEAESLLQTATPVRVFCDLGLPDRAGYELHQKLSQVRPEIAKRFVFVTGGALTASVADYLVASGCPTLLKPIRAEEVEALLKQAPAPVAPPPERAMTSAPPATRGRPRSKRARANSTPLVPRGGSGTTPLVPRGSASTTPVVPLPAVPTTMPRSERDVPTTRRGSNARRGTLPATAAAAPPAPSPAARRATTAPALPARRAKKTD